MNTTASALANRSSSPARLGVVAVKHPAVEREQLPLFRAEILPIDRLAGLPIDGVKMRHRRVQRLSEPDRERRFAGAVRGCSRGFTRRRLRLTSERGEQLRHLCVTWTRCNAHRWQ